MKKKVITEGILVIVIVQGLLILLEQLLSVFFPNTDFFERIITMISMIILTVVIILYARKKETTLSFFSQPFTKLSLIITIITIIFLVSTPSNYTGGCKAILLLIYGSIVTTIFEELLLRGYIWNRFKLIYSDEKKVYIWNVLLFTVWHLGYMLPQLFAGNWFAVLTKLLAGLGYGIVLGFIRLKSNNCYLTTLVHGILNNFMI